MRDGEVAAPDVLLIDGGKGQLAEAAKVLDELGITGITLIGVAKGPDRRPASRRDRRKDREARRCNLLP